METVISIDNRLGKTANVYDEHLSCLKNNKKKRNRKKRTRDDLLIRSATEQGQNTEK